LEKYGNYMKLRVPRKDQSIGSIFGLIEDMKSNYEIDTYSLSHTTLDQIFQSFANLNFDESIQKYALSQETGELYRIQK